MIRCLVMILVCSMAIFPENFVYRNTLLFFPTYFLTGFLDDYYTFPISFVVVVALS